MGRQSAAHIAALVREHSSHPSLAALGRAIEIPDLSDRLGRARRAGNLPSGDLLHKIARELEPVGQSLLVDALAWDAALPGYDGDPDLSRRIEQGIRGLDMGRRRMLIELLGLQGVSPHDW